MAGADEPPATPDDARRMILADRLAMEAFREVEIRYGRGLTLEEAKRAVLDERVPAWEAEHGGAAVDAVIQRVMNVPIMGVSPVFRKKHRSRRWAKLVEAHVTAGGAAPSPIERILFDWFGRVPKRMRDQASP